MVVGFKTCITPRVTHNNTGIWQWGIQKVPERFQLKVPSSAPEIPGRFVRVFGTKTYWRPPPTPAGVVGGEEVFAVKYRVLKRDVVGGEWRLGKVVGVEGVKGGLFFE